MNISKMLLFALLVSIVAGVGAASALNPSKTYSQRPEQLNMDYKEAKVRTNDGNATLNVWDVAAKTKATSTVLLLHSGEGNMGDYLGRVDQFISNGYNVVIFDWRGFGESSEFEIDNNMYLYPHFQDDMASMIDYCRKNHSATFDLYGWGIGGGLALGVGWHRPEAKRIVADTPFHSMEDLEERFSSWDEPMEVPFAGYETRHEPKPALATAPGKNLAGVLLIIGSNDMLFSVADMNALHALNKKIVDKEILVVENPDRKDNFRVDKAAYFNRIKAFLGGN